MNGIEIDVTSGEEMVRLVRALGQHRYVAGRLHLVHAFAVEAACALGAPAALAEASAWASRVLADPAIDVASKDERLQRNVGDAELVAVLEAFWTDQPARDASFAQLRRRLGEIGAPIEEERLPFDEDAEDELFPVLVDAGFELLPIAGLDPERHKGALGAFEDAFALQVARFEEENAVPPVVPLHELPALGATELLAMFDVDGTPRAPFVLWTSGNETYLDYVLRGVLRAAKLAV